MIKKIFIIDEIIQIIIDGDTNNPSIRSKFFTKDNLTKEEQDLITQYDKVDLSTLSTTQFESIESIVNKYIK